MRTYRTIALTLAALGLAAGCSNGGPPPDAAQILKADGFTQLAVPGYPIVYGVRTPKNFGDGITSQAVGVSTSNRNLYQAVYTFAPAAMKGFDPTAPGGMFGGNKPGRTITKQGDAVVITGTRAALGI